MCIYVVNFFFLAESTMSAETHDGFGSLSEPKRCGQADKLTPCRVRQRAFSCLKSCGVCTRCSTTHERTTTVEQRATRVLRRPWYRYRFYYHCRTYGSQSTNVFARTMRKRVWSVVQYHRATHKR